MGSLRYHRQLSRSIYIWGVFTPNDFSALIAALAFNILILDSNAGMLAILVGYPLYLASFRLGRPPGYDVHLFRSRLLPRLLRPAREERPAPLP
ncbi:MAG: hypothetical protein ACREFX_13980 [Opitutaceae bacterium]